MREASQNPVGTSRAAGPVWLGRSGSFALSLLTMVLLWASFTPAEIWPLAYVALVPWGLMLAGTSKPRTAILLSWLAGFLYWLVMLYWLAMSTMVGWIAGSAYLSLYWLAGGLMLRAALRRNWPAWIVLPVIWVALEFVRAQLIPFSWFFLAQSQYRQLPLIQIADVTGEYGISFLIAMVNGVLLDLLRVKLGLRTPRPAPSKSSAPPESSTPSEVSRFRRVCRDFTGVIASVILAAMMLIYGEYRLVDDGESNPCHAKIGIVQEAFAISLAWPPTSSRDMLDRHLQRSMDFAGKECDLVIWPETMLPRGLNHEILDVDVATLDDRNVQSLANRLLTYRASRDYPVGTLRGALATAIGPGTPVDHLTPAARYLVSLAFRDETAARLDEETLRTLVGWLYGKAIARPTNALTQPLASLTPATLRDLVTLYRPDADFSAIPDKTIQLAAEAVLGATKTKSRSAATLRKPLRQEIKRQLRRQQATCRTRKAQAAMLQVCSRVVDAPLLVGGSTIHRNTRSRGMDDLWVFHNSAMWYTVAGVSENESAKEKLVPFSEYVPCKYSAPWLHGWLRGFVPDAMPQLEPGKGAARFPLRLTNGDMVELVTPICYEGTISSVIRNMATPSSSERVRGQLIVNLSNDGWFTHPPGVSGWWRAALGATRADEVYVGTAEQKQHLIHSVFRAIENDVPIVRAVNTGISALIDANGRIESQVFVPASGSDGPRETMVAGSLIVEPVVNLPGTLYTFYGDGFALAVFVAAMGMLVALWRCGKRDNRTQTIKKCGQ